MKNNKIYFTAIEVQDLFDKVFKDVRRQCQKSAIMFFAGGFFLGMSFMQVLLMVID